MMPPTVTTAATQRTRVGRRLGIAVAVTAGSVLGWPRLAAWQRGQFAEQLARRAVQSTELSVESVREMWQLGLPATGPLVELAAAQRTELAVSAQDAISNQLAAWEVEFANGGDAGAFAERLEILSSSLRANAGRFDGAGQLWAKKLAHRIIQYSAQLQAGEAWAVLTACEHVLSTPDLARPAAPAVVYEDAVSAKPRAAVIAAPVEAKPLAVEAKPLPVALPIEAKSATDAPPSPPAELSVIMPQTEPPQVSGVDPDNPLRPAEESPVMGDSMQITVVPNVTAAPIDVPSPLDMRHNQQRLRELSDRNLMTLANTASRFEAAAARQVLRMRGYSEELLKLTGQLRGMPPRERREALERAAALPAAEARRLLRWFVADEDAEVRLHALTMLATTGDPQLSEIARERAIEDADPRVAELATQLLNTR